MAAREVLTLNEQTPQIEVPQSGDTYEMPRDVNITGSLTITGTVDGRDVAADGALAATAVQPGDNISDLTNDSGFTDDTAADAAQATADAALPKSGGTMTGNITMSGAETVDGRDLSVDGAKLDYITITQAVDLDTIESRVNALDAAVVLKGSWDASAGTFPGSGSAQAGDSYIVSTGGTVDSVVFTANDRIVALTDNASTTTYSANWLKLDYTDAVLSVAGKTGAITLAASDITDFDTEVGNNSAVTANTAKVTNATHTGDATGDTALTLAATAISGKSEVTAAHADYLLILDTSVSPHALKKSPVSDLTAEVFSSDVATVDNEDYVLWEYAPFAGEITAVGTFVGTSGTCTITGKVTDRTTSPHTTTNLGGTANSASTTYQEQAHGSSNTFNKGDKVFYTASSNSSCLNLAVAFYITRTD